MLSFFYKAVALRMDCAVAGTSRTLTTSTGRVVGDAHGPTTQVLFLATAVLVSLLLSILLQ